MMGGEGMLTEINKGSVLRLWWIVLNNALGTSFLFLKGTF